MGIMEFQTLSARVGLFYNIEKISHVPLLVSSPSSHHPWDTPHLAGSQPESQNIKKSVIKGGDSFENICITLPTRQKA